jgi:hypothetical protein
MAEVNKLILQKDPGLRVLQPLIEDMTQFIRDRMVHVVAVGGSSAQPVAVEVRRTWQKMFPGEPAPYFVALGKVHSPVSKLDVDEIMHVFLSRGRKVGERQNKRCFILEEFISSGKAMDKLKRAMTHLGFKEVLAGSLLVSERNSHRAEELDFAGALSKTKPRFDIARRHIISQMLKARKRGKWKIDRGVYTRQLQESYLRIKRKKK